MMITTQRAHRLLYTLLPPSIDMLVILLRLLVSLLVHPPLHLPPKSCINGEGDHLQVLVDDVYMYVYMYIQLYLVMFYDNLNMFRFQGCSHLTSCISQQV
jgi:hypothetical protein